MNERRTGSRRGRRQGRSITLISWRDIPAQLTGRDGSEQHKLLLDARFQHAIDRAAGVAGLTSTNDYVQEWRSVPQETDEEDLPAQLDRLAASIDSDYPRDRLEALVASGGLNPPRNPPT